MFGGCRLHLKFHEIIIYLVRLPCHRLIVIQRVVVLSRQNSHFVPPWYLVKKERVTQWFLNSVMILEVDFNKFESRGYAEICKAGWLNIKLYLMCHAMTMIRQFSHTHRRNHRLAI